ncbi:hypothetical protein ACFYO1_39070 [Nocardia sp. NPDC006044]|uniref:hypothetical protein n=1 Tax=Nocardia sp. NPDC006044 TaxID=3364306 RepID=UPI0036B94BBC
MIDGVEKPGDATVQVPIATASASASGEGTLSVVVVATRQNMATQHLWTARHAARKCGERESAVLLENRIDLEHRSLTMSAVISSVCFLEALVNEAFADVADNAGRPTTGTEGISDHAAAVMAELWNGAESLEKRLSILEKYQLALVSAGKPRMDPGAMPYQGAKKLIDLRNALVHFKPAWEQVDVEHKLRKSVRDLFAENQQPVGLPWFPNRCLGAGCAEWSCAVSVKFADHWWEQMGLVRDFHSDFAAWPEP